MRLRIFILFSILLFVASCSNGNKVPDNVIPPKRMVNLLVEIHLSEAINGQRFRLDQTGQNFTNNLYFSICKAHAIDPRKFANSVLYYGKHPSKYDAIYDQVLNRLNEMEEKVKKEKPKFKPDNGKH